MINTFYKKVSICKYYFTTHFSFVLKVLIAFLIASFTSDGRGWLNANP